MSRQDNPIEFFFDFASPYSYFTVDRLEDLAGRFGRTVAWRPIILWPIMRQIGLPPPMESGAKGVYLAHDMQRSARFYGIDYRHPEPFPGSSHLPARAFIRLAKDSDDRARSFARAMFRAVFVDGKDVGDPATALVAARHCGADVASVQAAMDDPEIKTELTNSVAEASRRGVCGVPFMFVDDEPFFGADRLDQIECMLEKGDCE